MHLRCNLLRIQLCNLFIENRIQHDQPDIVIFMDQEAVLIDGEVGSFDSNRKDRGFRIKGKPEGAGFKRLNVSVVGTGSFRE